MSSLRTRESFGLCGNTRLVRKTMRKNRMRVPKTREQIVRERMATCTNPRIKRLPAYTSSSVHAYSGGQFESNRRRH